MLSCSEEKFVFVCIETDTSESHVQRLSPFPGVVYGDLGTSPLYVYNTTFVMGVTNVEDVIGVTSLVMWLLIMSPLVKYCFVVLTCDDNGEGETHMRDPKSVPTNGHSIVIRTNIA